MIAPINNSVGRLHGGGAGDDLGKLFGDGSLAGLVVAQFELTKYTEALKTCDKLLELEPNDLVIIYAKATTLYKLKIYNEAIECYDKILKVTDNFNVLLLLNCNLLFICSLLDFLRLNLLIQSKFHDF